ncbi:FAD:protein FMN transferase [Pseudorhodobacter sp. W20_MBD10_FR17]|uniref:FAD:protein FMN transferase n=1 Tax=Pseudorhodobacter sp. W20_MBD10_FR17 TaxID=3240266 RepID=UPI003F963723
MPFHPTRRQMIALIGATLWAGTTRAETTATQTIQGQAFASPWRITTPNATDAETHRVAIDALLAEIDQQMSPWRDDSEITRFNTVAQETAASPQLTTVAQAALTLAQISNGWFDPTVGPQVAQWGFGPIKGASMGVDRWQGLHATGDSLHKNNPTLTMDLCGIAKGYALDRMAEHLQNAGLQSFLIDLGGELKSAGQHPSGRDWHVAIEDPRQTRIGPATALRLPSGLSVATSGLRAQSYALGGVDYGHIINPHSAQPATGTLASVSVLHSSAMLADGWATALAAAEEAAPQLAAENGIAALFLFTTNGSLHQKSTGGFDRHLL